MNKIYVVVEVTYDYHRFQENLFASTNKDDCLGYIRKLNKKLETYEYQSTYCPKYAYIRYDSQETYLRERELNHYWIQEFNNEIPTQNKN